MGRLDNRSPRVCRIEGCGQRIAYNAKLTCAEHNLARHPGHLGKMRRLAWAAKLKRLSPRERALARLLPATIHEIRDRRPDLYPFERGNTRSMGSSRERMKRDLRALGAYRVGQEWRLTKNSAA